MTMLGTGSVLFVLSDQDTTMKGRSVSNICSEVSQCRCRHCARATTLSSISWKRKTLEKPKLKRCGVEYDAGHKCALPYGHKSDHVCRMEPGYVSAFLRWKKLMT